MTSFIDFVRAVVKPRTDLPFIVIHCACRQSNVEFSVCLWALGESRLLETSLCISCSLYISCCPTCLRRRAHIHSVTGAWRIRSIRCACFVVGLRHGVFHLRLICLCIFRGWALQVHQVSSPPPPPPFPQKVQHVGPPCSTNLCGSTLTKKFMQMGPPLPKKRTGGYPCPKKAQHVGAPPLKKPYMWVPLPPKSPTGGAPSPKKSLQVGPSPPKKPYRWVPPPPEKPYKWAPLPWRSPTCGSPSPEKAQQVCPPLKKALHVGPLSPKNPAGGSPLPPKSPTSGSPAPQKALQVGPPSSPKSPAVGPLSPVCV